MRYFPFFFDLKNKSVLVVGGGEDALRKIRLLLKTNANVIVAAEELETAIWALVDAEEIAWIEGAFIEDMLSGVACVISAQDGTTGMAVSKAAKARNIPVNVVDEPELSTILFPAIVDRDPVVVAVGTEGTGPVLAQGIRAHLESYLPLDLGRLAEQARLLRPTIGKRLKPGLPRRRFWHSFFFGALRDRLLAGDDQEFKHKIDAELLRLDEFDEVSFKVIVPENDDTELLSLKAYRALQEADLIIYARSQTHVLELARRDAIFMDQDQLEASPMPGSAYQSHRTIVRIIDPDQFDWMSLCDVFPGSRVCSSAIEVIPPSAQPQAQLEPWDRLLPAAAKEAENWRLAS